MAANSPAQKDNGTPDFDSIERYLSYNSVFDGRERQTLDSDSPMPAPHTQMNIESNGLYLDLRADYLYLSSLPQAEVKRYRGIYGMKARRMPTRFEMEEAEIEGRDAMEVMREARDFDSVCASIGDVEEMPSDSYLETMLTYASGVLQVVDGVCRRRGARIDAPQSLVKKYFLWDDLTTAVQDAVVDADMENIAVQAWVFFHNFAHFVRNAEENGIL